MFFHDRFKPKFFFILISTCLLAVLTQENKIIVDEKGLAEKMDKFVLRQGHRLILRIAKHNSISQNDMMLLEDLEKIIFMKRKQLYKNIVATMESSTKKGPVYMHWRQGR